MGKRGPKLTPINWEDFDKLCSLHCTLVEIAEWFDCSEDTIERACVRERGEKFAEIFKKKSSKGKISLRRKMFEIAMGGNVGMCIWLSKQHLGMSDKQDVRSEVTQDVRLEAITPEKLREALNNDPFMKTNEK